MKKVPIPIHHLKYYCAKWKYESIQQQKMLMNLLSKDECDSARHYFLDENNLTK